MTTKHETDLGINVVVDDAVPEHDAYFVWYVPHDASKIAQVAKIASAFSHLGANAKEAQVAFTDLGEKMAAAHDAVMKDLGPALAEDADALYGAGAPVDVIHAGSIEDD